MPSWRRVCQWIGNDGNAVIITRDFQIWLRIKKLENGEIQVVRDRKPHAFVQHMRQSRVIEEEIPRLLHELTVRQSVECLNDDGQKLRLRVEPGRNPAFFIEIVSDEEPWHRYPNGRG